MLQIHPFIVYNSVVFSIFTELYNYHYSLFECVFIASVRNSTPKSYHCLLPYPLIPKKTLICFHIFVCSHSPLLPTSHPKKTLIYFWFYSLFWTFRINRIIQYVVFCKFFHLAQCF